MKVEVVTADHQNKPDIGAGIARQWFDVDKVDAIVDVPNSGVALAVNEVAKEKNRRLPRFRRRDFRSDRHGNARPTPIHWTYDTYAGQRHRQGAWSRRAATPGSSSPPITPSAMRCSATPPRSSRPMAARCSAASTCRSTRRISRRSCCRRRPRRPRSSASPMPAATPPIRSSRRTNSASSPAARSSPALLLFITDVNALGLEGRAGAAVLTETFYWDMNDGTRAFAKRFAERIRRTVQPTMVQAGVYSSVIALSQGARGARRQSARRRQGRSPR